MPGAFFLEKLALPYTSKGLVYLYFFAVLTAIMALPQLAHAQLVVTDCYGFTRAVQNVDAGSLSNVEVSVNDALGNPLNGTEVTLTNSVTGEITTVVSQNGVATFSNIAPGTFSVSTAATGASVGTVSVATASVGTVAAAGAVGATAAVGGGAAVGAVAATENVTSGNSPSGGGEEGGGGSGGSEGGGGSSGGGSGGGSEVVPTPIPTVAPTLAPPSSGGGSSSGGSTSGSSGGSSESAESSCGPCDPNEEAPSLSEEEFFGVESYEEQKKISPFA